jgi:GT2 family glycosyltransferase
MAKAVGQRPMTESPLVIVAMLNYNRASDTIECVRSLRECTYQPLEIVIVDNGSTDNSLNILQTEFVDITVISTGSNLGYTGGINFSLEIVRRKNPTYVLVINNDTIVQPSFLNFLVEAMERNTTAAAAGGTIYCFHDKTKVWYGGGRLVRWRGLAVHDKRGSHVSVAESADVKRVSFISGCLILFRVSSLEMIGKEDERFFMYLDDIELSSRILSKGFDLLYVPKSIVYHKVLGETESPFKLYYSVRNRLLLISLMNSGVSELIARLYFLTAIAVKLVVWKFHKPLFYKAALLGLKDYFRGDFYRGKGFDFV